MTRNRGGIDNVPELTVCDEFSRPLPEGPGESPDWGLGDDPHRRGRQTVKTQPITKMNAAELVLLLESVRDFREFYWSLLDTATILKIETDAKAGLTELRAGG